MASIRVEYLGNEDGFAVVKYGGHTYYCNFSAFGDAKLTAGKYYNIDHRELFAR